MLPCDFAKDGLKVYSNEPNIREKFFLSLNGLHNPIAKFFHLLHFNRFRCVSKRWFEFVGHVWEPQSENETDIITAVLSSEDFLRPYVQALEFYQAAGSSIVDALGKANKIDALLRNLQSGPFKSHVLGECAETFRYNHRDFPRQMDKAYLTPFENGVLELDTLNFRDGLPSDMMTRSMQVDYNAYDPCNPHDIHREILSWFEQVQPDPQLRAYVQKLTGLLLTPDTNLQKVWIFSGIGRNGKSFFLNKVLQPAMGTFFATGQTTILTRKREAANEANGAIVDLIGSRVAVFMEPAKNEVIQAETLKLISGEDRMSVRALYAARQQVFTPTFKAIIACNDRPKMSEDSFAVWRRIRVVHWPILFTETPDRNNKCERLLDPLLDEKVKRWPPFFAGLMVHWLKQYRAEGLSDPYCVVQHTKQYEEEHDDWKEFRQAYLARRPGKCQWTDLYKALNHWLGNTLNKKTHKETTKQYFVKHLGPLSDAPVMAPNGGAQFRGWNDWHLDYDLG